MSTSSIATAFSNGRFDEALDFIAEDAIWTIVGESQLVGKAAIEVHCGQVAQYFKSVTTNFKTEHIIEDDHHVVVSGTAEFLRDEQRLSFISACDVYEFNKQGLIAKVTSYCIQEK
jgi:ketosteroid isomerase-like protein